MLSDNIYSRLKSIISQQEEVEDQECIAACGNRSYSTISSSLVSVEISSDVTPGGDHVAMMDTEQVNWLLRKEPS